MKKYINVLLLIEGRKPLQVQFDTTQGLHEFQIYEVLQQMFPVYIFINTNVDENIYQEGYNVEFKNGLHSVAIYRSNP
jgi:hypothetical protein